MAEAVKIGFIGLGRMGHWMAQNLANKAGANLVVYDKVQDRVQELKNAVPGKRVTSATSPKDVAAQVSTCITMLPSNEHVQDVYTNPSTGLLKGALQESLLIDCSTIEPKVAKSISEESQSLGVSMIDAPVSGGVMGAQNASLTFLVGGTHTQFELAKPFLSMMGTRFILCGATGSGQIAKICNNLLLAIQMAGLSEALALGVKLGVDARRLSEVINSSSGRCWASELYNPEPGIIPSAPSSHEYAPGFASSLMLKDVSLAISSAQDARCVLPLGTVSQKLYSESCSKFGLARDFSIVYQHIKSLETQQPT